MYKTSGRIYCYESGWLIINANNDIAAYYRKLIHYYSRPIQLMPPKHGAHVTGIAGTYEQPPDFEIFWKFHLQPISFRYSNEVQTDGSYYWLRVECEELEEIRKQIGLMPTIKYPWHLTIGNLKHNEI